MAGKPRGTGAIGALVFALVHLAAADAHAQEAADMPFAADDMESMSGEDAPAVTVYGGVGFAYGMTRAEAARRCQTAGFRFFRARVRGAYGCTGVPARVERSARTILRFCHGRLCEVDVLMPLEERNRGVSRWVPWFREIRDAMEGRYGPSGRATAARPPCLESDAALGRCVLRHGAHVSAQWFPDNGGMVSLHLVRVRGRGPHLRVIYASATRTGDTDRPPARPARHALAMPVGRIPF
jgi:hypothetical protein